jgi:hypothetical protein
MPGGYGREVREHAGRDVVASTEFVDILRGEHAYISEIQALAQSFHPRVVPERRRAEVQRKDLILHGVRVQAAKTSISEMAHNS